MVPHGSSENGDGNIAVGMPFHSISIRIVSSYLQVAGLLMRFDLTLPDSVTSLVTAEASSSSLSEQLLQFECGTSIRNDRDLFLLRQVLSVWLLPLISIACCVLFWFVAYVLCCWSGRKKKNSKNKKTALDVSPMDGFVSSLMVLFYTLFPSVVNRVALTFSCKTYGDRLLLTEALTVQCFADEAHRFMMYMVGIPGMLLFVFFIPGAISRTLIKQSKAGKLYPTQPHYEPKWTLRIGFMFAGYREGYEGWEAIVMLRKCGFVMLSVFLRSYGPSPQVVAASIVLIVATSAHLQHRPYVDEAHNWLESCGLHACIAQLLVTLISNMIGRIPDETRPSQWTIGPVSTAVVIAVVFCSTAFFFWTTFVWTTRRSHGTKGAVGAMARCCHQVVPQRICVLAPRRHEHDSSKGIRAASASGGGGSGGDGGGGSGRGKGYIDRVVVAPTVVVPSSHEQTHQSSRTRLNARLVMMGLNEHRNQVKVSKLEERVQRVKMRKVASIKRRGTEHSARLQLRLKARDKVKHNNALQKCAPFANLSAESIATIVDAMEFKTARAGAVLCRQGEVANRLFLIVDGACDVTIGEEKVAVLPELSVFGESALFEGGIRNATVAVSGDAHAAVKLLVLSRRAHLDLMQSGTLDAACVRALQEVAARRQRMNEKLSLAGPPPPPKKKRKKKMKKKNKKKMEGGGGTEEEKEEKS